MAIDRPRPYRLGRLPFSLAGAGDCVDYLHAELQALRVPASGGEDGAGSSLHAPRVAFEFVSALPPLTGYTASRPICAVQDAYRVSYKGLEYQVSSLAQGANGPGHSPTRPAPEVVATVANVPPMHIAIRANRIGSRDRFSIAIQRVRHPSYLSIEELYARSFSYELFDHITQVAQLRLGQSYLHASSVERDGGGTAIIAWGGVGKTSALVKLIAEHGFRYLSDDIALVDDSGVLWRTPKLIQLHAFNVRGEDRLRSMLLRDRPALDRAAWSLRLWRHGPRGVRRRISAERLFGAGSVATRATLERVYCLERADIRDFEVSQISTTELCRRAARVVMDVMEPFSFLSQALHSGHHAPILPNPVDVAEATSAVLARAFRFVPAFNIRIPLAAPPAALAACLVGLIDGSARFGGRMASPGAFGSRVAGARSRA